MTEFSVETVVGLADHIDDLLDRRRLEIYWVNKDRNAPRVAVGISGGTPTDPVVSLEEGSPDLEEVFQAIIDPNYITGSQRGRGPMNLQWDDIRRNGLGPNQYERIAQHARYLHAKATATGSLVIKIPDDI